MRNGSKYLDHIGITLLKVTGFIAFMLIIGKRLVPMIMQFVARLGSRELFTLTVVAAAVSIAYGSYAIFGVSMALGLSLQEWWLKSLILAIVPKKKRSLYVKFFRFYFSFLLACCLIHIFWSNNLYIFWLSFAIIMVGKTLAAMALVLFFRYPINTALTVGASLAQIGEFSFILATLGVSLGLLT
jgi:CPA2 family monovalent cation:H+ antiporter-2